MNNINLDFNIIVKLIIFFALFDGIWLGFIANEHFKKAILDVTNLPISPPVRIYSVVLAYITMIAGAYIFVLPNISKENLLRDSLFYGGLFGLITYGIFDFTNHAIFPGWGLKTVVIDMLWGAFLFASVSYLTILF